MIKRTAFLMLIFLLIFSVSAMVQEYEEAEVIKEIKGASYQTTRPFVVSDRWEVQWEVKYAGPDHQRAKESMFRLKLYSTDNPNLREHYANFGRFGEGSFYRQEGGEFFLDIRDLSWNEWKITIIDLEPTCIFCGSDEDLIEFKGKRVCGDCTEDLCDC